MSEKEQEIQNEEAVQQPVDTDTTEGTENTEATTEQDSKTEETAEIQEEPKTTEQLLEEAQTRIKELETQALYKQAEFENFRKRTLKEKADLILNGGSKTITAILPVLDDFERAMQSAEKAEDVAALKEGMDLIFKKFIKILEQQGVKQIDTKDAEFNTDLHEAVAMVPGMGEAMKNKVIDCVQTGYTLNDKVIRHAKVAVGQ